MGHGLGFGCGVIGLAVSSVSGRRTPRLGLVASCRRVGGRQDLLVLFAGRTKHHFAQPGNRHVFGVENVDHGQVRLRHRFEGFKDGRRQDGLSGGQRLADVLLR